METMKPINYSGDNIIVCATASFVPIHINDYEIKAAHRRIRTILQLLSMFIAEWQFRRLTVHCIRR